MLWIIIHRLELGAALLGLAASLGLALLLGPTSHPALPAPLPTTAAARYPATPTPAPRLVVYITGAVAHPGVYQVPPGSRVYELLTQAGGPAPGADLGAVNLAARVLDGAQVAIPWPPTPRPTAPPKKTK